MVKEKKIKIDNLESNSSYIILKINKNKNITGKDLFKFKLLFFDKYIYICI